MTTSTPPPLDRLGRHVLHTALLLTCLTLLPGCPMILDWPPRGDEPPPRPVELTDANISPDWERFGGPDMGPSEPWDTGGKATADVWSRQPNRFAPVKAALVIGNVTGETRVVRMRALRPTVEIDCDAIEATPHLALRPQHFAPAQSWLVESGRAVPMLPRDKGACSAVLIDGTDVPQRLVFWRHSAWPITATPSTTEAAKATKRHIAIIAVEGEATWDKHATVFAAPSLFDPVAAKGCAMPSAEHDLTWTPLPAGSQTLVDVLTSPDGCSAMDLLTDLGVKRVYVCMPTEMMPFKAGDDLYIAALPTGHNVQPIKGVELLSDSGHVRMGRGSDVVYFGKGDANIAVTTGCPALHDEAGTYARAMSVTLQEPGQKTLQLDNGATHTLADDSKLHLVRAIKRLVWDTAVTGTATTNLHIESVWSKP